jgi:hypothetical protein
MHTGVVQYKSIACFSFKARKFFMFCFRAPKQPSTVKTGNQCARQPVAVTTKKYLWLRRRKIKAEDLLILPYLPMKIHIMTYLVTNICSRCFNCLFYDKKYFL